MASVKDVKLFYVLAGFPPYWTSHWSLFLLSLFPEQLINEFDNGPQYVCVIGFFFTNWLSKNEPSDGWTDRWMNRWAYIASNEMHRTD